MNRTAAVVAASLGLVPLVVLWKRTHEPKETVLAEAPRSPVSAPDPAIRPEAPHARSMDAALEELVERGSELGLRLDLVSGRPDPDALAELRDLVVAGRIDAARLRARASELPGGDPRRVVLVLVTAWARDVTSEDEAWLHRTAVGWNLASVDAEHEALAGVWALDLGRRAATLERVVGDLLERHRGAAAGDESFPGLSRIRVWHALRGLERFDGPAPLLEGWLSSTNGEQRVGEELWALAARTDPDRWGRLALERAAAGDAAARGGVETLADVRFLDALAELALDPGPTANELWCASAAWKAIVSTPHERARRLVAERLASSSAMEREVILEALRTWRTPPRPERTFASLRDLEAALAEDPRARDRLALELDRRRRAWALRRDDA